MSVPAMEHGYVPLLPKMHGTWAKAAVPVNTHRAIRTARRRIDRTIAHLVLSRMIFGFFILARIGPPVKTFGAFFATCRQRAKLSFASTGPMNQDGSMIE